MISQWTMRPARLASNVRPAERDSRRRSRGGWAVGWSSRRTSRFAALGGPGMRGERASKPLLCAAATIVYCRRSSALFTSSAGPRVLLWPPSPGHYCIRLNCAIQCTLALSSPVIKQRRMLGRSDVLHNCTTVAEATGYILHTILLTSPPRGPV